MPVIVLLMENAAKVSADVVGTDQLNAWLPSSKSSMVPKRTTAEMDFTVPASRIEKMQRFEYFGKLVTFSLL